MKTSHKILMTLALAGSISLAVAQRGNVPQRFRAQRHHIRLSFLPQPTTQTHPGDPLPGLSPAQLADFSEGLLQFQEEDTVESGLGPIFNNVSCVACHSVPAVGGTSDKFVTRFGRYENGHFDPLERLGGSLLQQSAIDPQCQEVIPAEANIVTRRIATPLFGLGLIEAIPESALVQLASARKPDGIRGKLAMVHDVASGQMRVGRFGWKAQQATILSFSGDAYLNEVGITSRLFPTENAPNGNANLLAKFDLTADYEDQEDPGTGKADIDSFADFMRFLAPVTPLPLTRQGMEGQRLFSQIGCATCHVPALHTAPNVIPALNRKPVNLFSDLLLHDMGSLGDGIAQGAAGIREMKTAPLWGLRLRRPFLHDGRALTVDQAVRGHDGEGKLPRDRYLHITPMQRQQLLEYLNSI